MNKGQLIIFYSLNLTTVLIFPTVSPRRFLIGRGESSVSVSAPKIPSWRRTSTEMTARARLSSPSSIFRAMPKPFGNFSDGKTPHSQTPSAPIFEINLPRPGLHQKRVQSFRPADEFGKFQFRRDNFFAGIF